MLAERFLRTVWRNRLYWRTLGAATVALLLMVGVSVRHTWTQALKDYIGDLEIAAQTVVESLTYNPVPAETIDKVLQTLSMGSIYYAQWVQEGKVIAERRNPALTEIPPAPEGTIPEQTEVRRFSLPRGEPMVEIRVPFGTKSGTRPGYLRVGASLTPAVWHALVESASLLGLALGALLATALLAAVVLLLRSLRAESRSLPSEAERPPTAKPEVWEVGALRIDRAQRRVFRDDGTLVELSPKEYALLVLLASDPGRVFSDAEIRAHVWPNGHGVTRKDVTHYIYLLRRKLEKQGVSAGIIENVRGHGYRLSI